MNLWILIFLSPSSLYIFYDFIFYFMPMYFKSYTNISQSFYFFMIFNNCIAFICLTLFLFINRHRIKDLTKYFSLNLSEGGFKNLSVKVYVFLLLLILICIHILIYNVFGQVSYSEYFNNYARFYALSKRGTAWIFYLISLFIFIMILDFYFNGMSSRSRIFIFLLSVFSLAMTGGRSLTIVMLLITFFVFTIVHRNRIAVFKIIALTFLILIIFVGNSILRSSSFQAYIETKSITMDFDAAFILDDTLSYLKTNDVPYFLSLEDFVLLFIPRYFWPDKPMSTAETRLVYPVVAEYGTNYTFGLYSNLLLNCGDFTYLIIPLFIIISNLLYFYLVLNQKKSKFNFIVLFFILYYIQFLRGGLINYRLFSTFILLVLSFFVHFILNMQFKFR